VKGRRRRALDNDGKDLKVVTARRTSKASRGSSDIDIYFVVLEFYR